MEDQELYERLKIWEWLCRGYGRHGLEFRHFKYLTKEWIVERYNVELSYFKNNG